MLGTQWESFYSCVSVADHRVLASNAEESPCQKGMFLPAPHSLSHSLSGQIVCLSVSVSLQHKDPCKTPE